MVKVSIQCKGIYRFNVILIKVSINIFIELEKILKLLWKHKTPSIARTFLYNKNTARDITNPSVKLHYIVLAQKLSCWAIEYNIEIKTHTSTEFFRKEAKCIYQRQ